MKNKETKVDMETMTSTKPTEPTEIEKAQRLLQEEENKKVEACSREVNAVLEKHGYKINISNTVQLVRVG